MLQAQERAQHCSTAIEHALRASSVTVSVTAPAPAPSRAPPRLDPALF